MKAICMTEKGDTKFKAQRYFLTGPVKGRVKKLETVVDRLVDYYGDKLIAVRGRRENADTETKYDHYHLFLQFTTQVSFNKLKKVMDLGHPNNKRIATAQVATTAHYCVKGACGEPDCEHTWASHGDKQCKEFNQETTGKAVVLKYGEVKDERQRTDLNEARELIQSLPTWHAVVNHPELSMILARYRGWAQDCFANKPIPKFDEELWETAKRDWHDGVLTLLNEPADYRRIIWVWSADGDVGKSLLCAYLVQNKGACVLAGKTADMLYQYSKTMNDIVVMDIPRSGHDFVNYGAIEQIKNGVFAVGKYDSKMVVRGTPCHVLVLANEPPAEGMLSEDRMLVLNVDRDLQAMLDWEGWA